MIEGEIWLEELENLMKEIQEILRRREVGRGISIGLLYSSLTIIPHPLWICPHK